MAIGNGVSHDRVWEIFKSDIGKDQKNKVLMRDLILKYHPDYNDKKIRKHALNFSQHYDVERLVEETLAHVGGYNRIDESGRDFDCSQNSDSKTSMINNRYKRVEITSIENKIGALRITIFNPFKDCLDFFYIPQSCLEEVARPCYGKNKHKMRLIMSYNPLNDSYNQYDWYRMPTFESIAMARCSTKNSKFRAQEWAKYRGFPQAA